MSKVRRLDYVRRMKEKAIISVVSSSNLWGREVVQAAAISRLIYEMIDQYSVAFYAEDALMGGIEDRRFDIQFRLGMWKGDEFNKNINEYVNRDVICMGGDNVFAADGHESMTKIREAVHSRGAILLINFWSYYSLPEQMLPLTMLGGANYGTKLLPTDDLQRIYMVTKDAFPHKGNQLNRGLGKAKKGSTTWLTFDDGSPAVISWNYGKGMVLLRAFECNHFGIVPEVMLAIFDGMLDLAEKQLLSIN